ncbi:uncharacterized protein DUF4990 [Gramella sp. Hel_I_59]|uniref:right-handed parallel beta-helix repeat-containing protein n=1 Tax=Gramella sp. Hel_I_59 TaxID=1249978 RepID=UPI00114F0B6E|nr:right-handed parallel beta-helix repeat-containing protein [Gramella sp. Hel_I_59]TQI69310.1 uncharacterized protein DUF4990 [Gramella sp. Hel_I_59]
MKVLSIIFATIILSSCNNLQAPAQVKNETSEAKTKLIQVSTAEELIAALDDPNPGDSIVVSAGTYKLDERIYINDSGNEGGTIYLIGDISQERPLLDFSVMEEDSSNQGIVLKADNWHIKGFRVFKAGDNGLHIRGNNNLIEFCSFSECRDTGLQIDDDASKNTILNCDSYYNADSSMKNADGFAVKMAVGSDNKFIGCRAWNNSDDGWDGYLRGADNVTTIYENCWSFKNGFLKDGTNGKGDGNGFKTGGSDSKLTKHNASFFRCIAVDNVSDGFDHNSNRGTVSIINCSATGNGRNIAFAETLSLEKIVLLNTVVLGDYGKYNGESELVENNSWEFDFEVSEDDFVSVDSKELEKVRKKDGSLPDLDFMKPKRTSELAKIKPSKKSNKYSNVSFIGAVEIDK